MANNMSFSFQVGDLVWAKMKGFSPWPGRVSIPTLGLKPPKNMSEVQCIYFFGTNNYGWVKESNMKPYQEFKEKMMMYCNTSVYKAAVNDIDNYIKTPENFGVLDGPVQNGIEENGVSKHNGVNDVINLPNNVSESGSQEFGDIEHPAQIKKEIEEPNENGDQELDESPQTNDGKASTAVPPIMNAVLRLHKIKVYNCDECHAVYTSSNKLDEHSKIHVHIYSSYVLLDRTAVFRYKCKTCGQGFQQLRDCRLHELMHVRQDRRTKKCAPNDDNGIEKPYKCEVCGVRFVLQSTLTAHSVLHDPFPYLCDCGIGYFRETDFKAHRQIVHPKKRQWLPKINYTGPKPKLDEFVIQKPIRQPSPDAIKSSDESIDSPVDRAWNSKVRTKVGVRPKLKAELKKKKSKGKRSKTKSRVTKPRILLKLKNKFGEEIDILKNERGRYMCPICDKEFKSRTYVGEHYRVHTNEKPFACEHCDKRFSQKNARDIHLSLHGFGKRNHICDYCDAGYNAKSRLELHIINLHLGYRPYQCKICKKRFAQNLSLQTHTKIHVGIKNFKCMYCKKAFLNSNAMKLHERTHTGDKPFACTYCEKTFSDPSAYKRHIRTHTGDKRYACKLCPMKFSDASGLIAHRRRHTGIRTKHCDICPKKFFCNSDLNKHLLCVHASVRDYECNECEKKCSTKNNLKNHILRMHSLYFCDKCSCSFRTDKALRKHMAKDCQKTMKKTIRKEMNKESLDVPIKMELEE